MQLLFLQRLDLPQVPGGFLAAPCTGSCSLVTVTPDSVLAFCQSPAPARGGWRSHSLSLASLSTALSLAPQLGHRPEFWGQLVAVGMDGVLTPRDGRLGDLHGERMLLPRCPMGSQGSSREAAGGPVSGESVQMGHRLGRCPRRREGHASHHGCLSAACGSWGRGGSGSDLLSRERAASAV